MFFERFRPFAGRHLDAATALTAGTHGHAAGATTGDIAQALNQTRRQLHGNPIAVDVTRAAAAPDRPRRLDGGSGNAA